MPKDKFKPKEFSDYEREDKRNTEIDYDKRIDANVEDRPTPDEGVMVRSPKDVRKDYFSDELNEKQDRGELKPRQQRALKPPKRMLKRWDTRSAKRRNQRDYGR